MENLKGLTDLFAEVLGDLKSAETKYIEERFSGSEAKEEYQDLGKRLMKYMIKFKLLVE